ncbi:hypothetical protein HMPREF9069_00257 [Atopobium sp. oral taxon 810 str. F0209]|nr:hypothetical protein HMPREF9069_00257 [Atopobium sp. oral taxon 810 str. F0209]
MLSNPHMATINIFSSMVEKFHSRKNTKESFHQLRNTVDNLL